jgi:Domain of unknown function (DUF6946)/HD domain
MERDANRRYLEAVSFAVDRHGAVRQARKGTDFPYVVHPIRVAEILDRFGYGEDVVMAGALHDTVEDASVTYAELTNEFGERISELVEKASESDKSLDWRTRKQHAIESAAAERDLEALAVVAADKLDNVRSLQETLRARGHGETWKIFNADRKCQHWYYRTLAQTLLEREPTNLLFRTLDAEVHALFPDERRATRFFAGKPFGNPQDARAYLADPIKHWRPKYSAFELATAWLGGDGVPPKVDSLLRTAFADYEVVEGFFEKQTKLDDLGRPSQTDLLLLLRVPAGLAVVGVEGKAKESFGPFVSEWTGDQRRLAGLCTRLGLEPESVQDLRYQLLHRTVAAVLEAQRYGADDAIMLVHSFDPEDASLGDYRAFAERLGLAGAEPDKLTNSKRLDAVTLRLAWVRQH